MALPSVKYWETSSRSPISRRLTSCRAKAGRLSCEAPLADQMLFCLLAHVRFLAETGQASTTAQHLSKMPLISPQMLKGEAASRFSST